MSYRILQEKDTEKKEAVAKAILTQLPEWFGLPDSTKEYHRRGVGRLLWEAFLQYAKSYDYEYVQVKTVQKGHYEEYDKTNCFYERLGFKELECMKSLWDEWNPCQVYVKYIG